MLLTILNLRKIVKRNNWLLKKLFLFLSQNKAWFIYKKSVNYFYKKVGNDIWNLLKISVIL